jgi:hypothetical protein
VRKERDEERRTMDKKKGGEGSKGKVKVLTPFFLQDNAYGQIFLHCQWYTKPDDALQ